MRDDSKVPYISNMIIQDVKIEIVPIDDSLDNSFYTVFLESVHQAVQVSIPS